MATKLESDIVLVIPTLFTQYFDIEIKIRSHSKAAIYLFTKIKQVAMSKNYPHTATCYSLRTDLILLLSMILQHTQNHRFLPLYTQIASI